MSNISRRRMLRLSGGVLLSIAASGSLVRTALAGESEAVSWERFLELCHELARLQENPEWDQARYTQDVQGLVRRLRLDDPKIAEFIANYHDKTEDFPEIRTMYYKQDFMVAMLEFEEGEVIPLHDHPDMTGVIFCTGGQTEIDHFDRLADAAPNGNPLLQKGPSIVMTAGNTAALTANRNNIHGLRATRFTRMIDVFTPPYDQDRVERSRYYTLDDSALGGEPGVFEAEESRNRPR